MSKFLDDKLRFNNFLEILPEEFMDGFVNECLWNAYYPRVYGDAIFEYSEYTKKLLSEFADSKINKAWKKFNKSFYILYKFLIKNFRIPKDSQDSYYLCIDIHHNFGKTDKASSDLWDKFKTELDEVAGEFEKAYKFFIETARKRIEKIEKKRLKNRWWNESWVKIILLISAISGILLFLISI